MSDKPLEQDPYTLFQDWLSMAKESEINDPEAMSIATSTKDGKPSVRMVLLKDTEDEGFKFHTNAESQKGSELLENPHAAICFHWKSLRKQVRAEGEIKIISDDAADEYFAGRPYNRQIGAWASQQSRPLESRVYLEEKITALEQQYPKGQTVPRPKYWKGFLLVPHKIEFWMDNPDRLHDRFIYTRNDNNGWDITRLYP